MVANLSRREFLFISASTAGASLMMPGNAIADGASPAPAVQVIEIDPADHGRIFEGIGAVSAGASSRLLIDYPEPQRSQVLDLLFKPNYGASFQHLKVEVGSGVNSTDGTEPSFMRTREDEDDYRGYEWWLMKEALQRNPNIILDCLSWGAPAWIGGGGGRPSDFFSQDMADYLVRFLHAAQIAHQLNIRYVGIWNEHAYDVDWIKLLRRTLDRNGLRNVLIVAADQANDWTIASQIALDADLRMAISAIAVHYPHFHSTPEAVATGLPLWSSEDGPWKGTWDGAAALARIYNRNYIQGRMTKTEIWSLITSYYDILPIPGSGVMCANTPWSGAYDTQPAIWATAMTTQFAQPGWRYSDRACTLIPGGSVVTFISPTGNDLSIVVETTEARTPQTLLFDLAKDFTSQHLHLWKTTEREVFIELASIPIHNRRVTVTVDAGAIYALTTTSTQHKGIPTSPAASPFPFPYYEDFETYRPGSTARFLSDFAGTFEVADRADGNGRSLRQVIVQRGIEWQPEPYPETIFGDKNWKDYEISIDVHIGILNDRSRIIHHDTRECDESKFHTGMRFVSVFGRIHSIQQNGKPPLGYWLKIDELGNWELLIEQNNSSEPNKNGERGEASLRSLLAAGTVHFDPKCWHTVKLGFSGDHIIVILDGNLILDKVDGSIPNGMAGFGSGWHTAEFDNLSVTPYARRAELG